MRRLLSLAGCLIAFVATPLSAQAVAIEGQVRSQNFTFQPAFWPEPTVVLLDAADVIEQRDDRFVPLQSQVMGRFISPLFTGEGRYRIDLPIVPPGRRLDTNGDGRATLGVFRILAAPNFAADSYLEQMEQDGGLSSVLRDELTGHVTEASFALFSEVGAENFPVGWGADRTWFTDDDEVAPVARGWSVTRLAADGTSVQETEYLAVIDTLEPAEAKSEDYSTLSYTAAFDALTAHLATRYAYTAFRDLDWQDIAARHRPRIVAAEAAGDPGAYFLALRDMAMELEDTHTVASAGYLNKAINEAVLNTELAAFGAEIGASPLVVSDKAAGIAPGDVILVDAVTPGTPAAEAGWTAGTRILEVNGKPAADHLTSLPLAKSTGVAELQPYMRAPRFFRFAPGKNVSFTFQNPGEDIRRTTMIAGDAASPAPASPTTYSGLPIDIRQLGGVAILGWTNFTDNMLTKIAVLEEALELEAEKGSKGMIIDLRGNGGGLVELYEIMASYFFSEDEPMPDWLFDVWDFDSGSGDFVKVYAQQRQLWSPRPDIAYDGPLVILIDDGCASACEYFTQHLQQLGRATVVGQHASLGAGGFVDRVAMPEGVTFQYTATRTTFSGTEDPNLEASGVVPDVRVPVTLATRQALRDGGDPVFDAAVEVIAELSDPRQLLVAQPFAWTAAATAALEEVTIDNPASYRVSFGEDGQFEITTDCGVTAGHWSLAENQLTLSSEEVAPTRCNNARATSFVSAMLGTTQLRFDGKQAMLIVEGGDYRVLQLDPVP